MLVCGPLSRLRLSPRSPQAPLVRQGGPASPAALGRSPTAAGSGPRRTAPHGPALPAGLPIVTAAAACVAAAALEAAAPVRLRACLSGCRRTRSALSLKSLPPFSGNTPSFGHRPNAAQCSQALASIQLRRRARGPRRRQRYLGSEPAPAKSLHAAGCPAAPSAALSCTALSCRALPCRALCAHAVEPACCLVVDSDGTAGSHCLPGLGGQRLP